jgi:hypothetical protein
MGDTELRELVRIRHNLRELAMRGERKAAAPLIERFTALSSSPAAAMFDLDREVSRWRAVFRME